MIILIHNTVLIYGNTKIGEKSLILENVVLGYPDRGILSEMLSKNSRIEHIEFSGTSIGENAVVRSNSIIYCKVTIGRNFRTGHNILIREDTTIGDNVLIGTNVVIDGNSTIGNNVSIQSNVYIPTNTMIEDNVFIGPCAVLANDKYPIRKKYELKGPVLRKGASIGANSTMLPGIEIGEGAMVAAGALVTKDIPAWKLAIGVPAKIVDLPQDLKVLNRI